MLLKKEFSKSKTYKQHAHAQLATSLNNNNVLYLYGIAQLAYKNSLPTGLNSILNLQKDFKQVQGQYTSMIAGHLMAKLTFSNKW